MKYFYLLIAGLSLSFSAAAENYSKVGKEFNIDPLLLRSFAKQESRENPWALNINGESCHKNSHSFVIKGEVVYCNSRKSTLKILKHISKNPWLLKATLKRKKHRFWFSSKRHASRFYKKHMSKLSNVKILRKKTLSTDIGLMQINWKYHNGSIKNIYKLLDPAFNLHYAAKYYAKLTKKYSAFVAIGKYHNKNNIKRQIRYRNQVLTIYNKLKGYNNG